MKIIKEDIENLETTETTVVPQPMGAAKEESKTLWDRFMEATKEPEDAPLFGAEDQPVPDEVVEPKVTLDESLFENKKLNESIIPFNQLNWEFQDGNEDEDYKEAANKVFNELKKAINNLALIPNGEGWLVDEFNVWDEFVEQTATKIMNAINAHYFENHPDSYDAGEDILVESFNDKKNLKEGVDKNSIDFDKLNEICSYIFDTKMDASKQLILSYLDDCLLAATPEEFSDDRSGELTSDEIILKKRAKDKDVLCTIRTSFYDKNVGKTVHLWIPYDIITKGMNESLKEDFDESKLISALNSAFDTKSNLIIEGTSKAGAGVWATIHKWAKRNSIKDWYGVTMEEDDIDFLNNRDLKKYANTSIIVFDRLDGYTELIDSIVPKCKGKVPVIAIKRLENDVLPSKGNFKYVKIVNESLNEDDDFEGFDVDTPDDNPEITDEMLQEVIDEVKDTIEEAEFTPEEVIEKVFDCIEDEEVKYELAADVVKSTEEEMAEEELTEDLVYGESTLDDYLDVIKKYYKNYTASEVIDSLFLNNPCMDEQTAFDVASTLGEMIEAMGAEELDW